jgi:dienelactone hydrolase
MGLFWSLQPPADVEPIPFVKEDLDPIAITLRCDVAGVAVADAKLERRFLDPGVTRTEVRERGLAGSYFRPAGGGPFATVLCLGGSDGGLREHYSAVLASHGIASLALGYFMYADLPQQLAELELEYFERALGWLLEQDGVDPRRLVVMGQSRGGELALLLGAKFPAVKAVIGYVPSGVVHAGMGEPTAPPPAAWTLAGKPFAFAGMDATAVDWSPPIRLAPGFRAGLRDAEAVALAEIPVERVGGPILLVSGRDDQMWPSTELAEIAVRRLAREGDASRCVHRAYDGAGHSIRLPNMPTTPTCMLHPVTGQVYELGGTPAGNARASRLAWAEVLEFLGSL